MMLPTIHMNGTPASRLVEEYDEAADLLRTAIRSLGVSGPNGRDYYPQGESAIYEAQREHADRIERVRAVLAEVEAIVRHCRKADDERRGR